jgi:hypothetical protein
VGIMTVASIVGTSSPPYFSLDSPAITYVTSNMPASAQLAVAITGLNLGQLTLTPTAGSDGSSCRTTSWTSTSSVTCRFDVLNLASIAKPQLTVSSQVGTLVRTGFSLDSPVASAAHINSPLSGGAWVTVEGLNFGFDESTPSALLGNAELCTSTSWTSLTAATCTSGTPTRPFVRPSLH